MMNDAVSSASPEAISNAVREAAPAKINLALHVTGRRADGYHLLESLVVFTRFGDLVEVAPADADSFVVDGPFADHVPADDSNLVVRACDALRRALETQRLEGSRLVVPPSVLADISPTRGEITHSNAIAHPETNLIGESQAASLISPLVGEMSGRTEGGNVEHRRTHVAIRLTKNLPVASGVGGGSSDAAATLKALANLWGINPDAPVLHEIAATLGADVPMCLAARPLVARGIGEELTRVGNVPGIPLVLVNPKVPVSTPAVFAALASSDNAPLPPLPRAFDFHSLRNWLETTRNDLEAPARRLAPPINKAIRALDKAESGFSRMSGSGATCFGIFETNNVAKRAAAMIRQRHPDWFVAATRAIPSEGTP